LLECCILAKNRLRLKGETSWFVDKELSFDYYLPCDIEPGRGPAKRLANLIWEEPC